MAVKKDAKSEFIDAYKKMFSKEQLKDMGKLVANEAKKPQNQIGLGVMSTFAPVGKIPKIEKGVKAIGKVAKAVGKKIKGTPRKKLTGYNQLANRVDMDYLVGAPYRVNKKTGKFKFRIEDEDIPFGKNVSNQPTSSTWSKNLKSKNKSGTYNPTKKEREQVRRFLDLNNLD